MKLSYTAALVPPAQAEAIYDLSLDGETTGIAEQASNTRIEWPHPASAEQVPQRVLFESPVRRSNTSRTRQ